MISAIRHEILCALEAEPFDFSAFTDSTDKLPPGDERAYVYSACLSCCGPMHTARLSRDKWEMPKQ